MADIKELRKDAHWSYSSLDQLLNRCSLQWAFGHIYKRPPESTGAELPFGGAFHAAASEFAIIKMSGENPNLKEIQDLFSEWWLMALDSGEKIEFKDGASAASMNETGRALIEVLYTNWIEDEKVIDVASAFSVEIFDAEGNAASEKPLIGEMDLVVMDAAGRFIVVDWKTSARRWPREKAEDSLQATCMCYGHALDIGCVPSFRFDVLVKNKLPIIERHPVERSFEDFNRMAELVKIADKIVKAEAYFPRKDWQCSGCAYSGACREWHRKNARIHSFAA
ncbi:MAG: hypothetical protein A2Y07_03900 [Planctomycetes bacterium GWF2_50_10]|nr:MAG: hypothetical protein A2Y07_03900 [Planctomycetes bacterium GWF2_50_10]